MTQERTIKVQGLRRQKKVINIAFKLLNINIDWKAKSRINFQRREVREEKLLQKCL